MPSKRGEAPLGAASRPLEGLPVAMDGEVELRRDVVAGKVPMYLKSRPYTLTEVFLAGVGIGIDTVLEPELTWVAEARLGADMPTDWMKCLDENGDTYFYNEA